MSQEVTYQGTDFRIDATNPRLVRFSPWGDVDFLCLMPSRQVLDTTESPDVTDLHTDGEALMLTTALGVYRLIGDVQQPDGFRIEWPEPAPVFAAAFRGGGCE